MARPWPTPPPGFISVQEAEARLGIHHDTLYRWLSNGRLPSAKWQERRVIPVEAVEALISERQAEAS